MAPITREQRETQLEFFFPRCEELLRICEVFVSKQIDVRFVGESPAWPYCLFGENFLFGLIRWLHLFTDRGEVAAACGGEVEVKLCFDIKY